MGFTRATKNEPFEVRTLGDGGRAVKCKRCGAEARFVAGTVGELRHTGPCLAQRQIETFTTRTDWTVTAGPRPS